MTKSNRYSTFYDCLKAKDKHGYEIEIFWLSGILLIIVGVLGLIGNAINFTILCQAQLRKEVFYNLLLSLTCFDTIFILSYGINMSYKSIACSPQDITFEDITFPFYQIGILGSLYMTVAISLERFLGICHPVLRLRRNVWFYLVPVFLVVIVFTLPIFAESKFFFINGTLTSSAKGIWSNDSDEATWKRVVYMFVYTIIPVFSLLVLNGLIIRELQKTPDVLRTVGPSRRKLKATKILLWIVIIFFILNMPRLAFKGLLYLAPEEKKNWYWVRPGVRLALVANSSLNFWIYLINGDRFRKQFLKIFNLRNFELQEKRSPSAISNLESRF